MLRLHQREINDTISVSTRRMSVDAKIIDTITYGDKNILMRLTSISLPLKIT